MLCEPCLYIITDYDSDVDIAGPKYWHIKVPADVNPSLKAEFSTSGPGVLELFRTPTTSLDGSSLTAVHYDEKSSVSCNTDFYKDPTRSADGTKIYIRWIGSYDSGLSIAHGGIFTINGGYRLKQSTNYLFKYTPVTDNQKITACIECNER